MWHWSVFSCVRSPPGCTYVSQNWFCLNQICVIGRRGRWHWDRPLRLAAHCHLLGHRYLHSSLQSLCLFQGADEDDIYILVSCNHRYRWFKNTREQWYSDSVGFLMAAPRDQVDFFNFFSNIVFDKFSFWVKSDSASQFIRVALDRMSISIWLVFEEIPSRGSLFHSISTFKVCSSGIEEK